MSYRVVFCGGPMHGKDVLMPPSMDRSRWGSVFSVGRRGEQTPIGKYRIGFVPEPEPDEVLVMAFFEI